MESSALLPPLSFCCRNARLCLKKAALAKRSDSTRDELRHLREFESLVGSSIPAHPSYRKKRRKYSEEIEELETYLVEARKRVKDLEAEEEARAGVRAKAGCRGMDRARRRDRAGDWRGPALARDGKAGLGLRSNPRSAMAGLAVLRSPPAAAPGAKEKQRGVSAEKRRKWECSSFREWSGGTASSLTDDHRLESILGGCTLLATKLRAFQAERGKDDPKSWEARATPSSDLRRSYLIHRARLKPMNKSVDFHCQEKDLSADKDREETHEAAEEVTLPTPKFRFAFEKTAVPKSGDQTQQQNPQEHHYQHRKHTEEYFCSKEGLEKIPSGDQNNREEGTAMDSPPLSGFADVIDRESGNMNEKKRGFHENLERKIADMQSCMDELKDLVTEVSSQVAKEGGEWKCRTEEMEKRLRSLRDETEMELLGFKGRIEDGVRQNLDAAKRDLGKSESEVFEAIAEMKLGQLNLSFVEAKASLVNEIRDRVSATMKEAQEALRREMKVMEFGIPNDLRQEMEQKIECVRTENKKVRKAERQQIELLIKESFDQQICGNVTVSDDVRNKLCLLWIEVDSLCKGRREVDERIEQLSLVAESAKENIGKEQDALRLENEMFRRQIAFFRKESMQMRVDAEESKKEMELEIDDLQRSLEKLRQRQGDDDIKKACNESLQGLGEELTESSRKLIEKMMKKVEMDVLERSKEEIKKEMKLVRSLQVDSDKERRIIVEKVERLSKMYLSGLDNVKNEISDMKTSCQDRIARLESQWQARRNTEESNDSLDPLRELLLDGLELRVIDLERRMQKGREDIDVDLLKTSGADVATEAATSARRVDELLSQMLGTFTSEMANMRRKTMKLHEGLALEKEKAAMAISEIKKMSADLGLEKEKAIRAFSDDAAQASLEIKGHLEEEKKNSVCLLEKASTQAEQALSELLEARNKSLSLCDAITEMNSQAQERYDAAQLRTEMESWKSFVMAELEKRMLSSVVSLSGRGGEELETRVQNVEEAISSLGKSMSDSNEKTENRIEGLQGRLQEFVGRVEKLSKQCMKTTEVKLLHPRVDPPMAEDYGRVELLRCELGNLEKKTKEVIAEQGAAGERVAEVWKKTRRLEGAQMSLVRSVEEVRAAVGGIEKSASLWVPKYEASARVLDEVKAKVDSLESRVQRQGDGGIDANHLTGLYKEMSDFIHKYGRGGGGGGGAGVGIDGVESLGGGIVQPPPHIDTRLTKLESRIETVESSTIRNLRYYRSMDAKVKHGLQAALDGAGMAESKCSALGAELVKVFRLLASAKKDGSSRVSVTEKSKDSGGHNHSRPGVRRHHHRMHMHTGMKVKDPSFHHHASASASYDQCRKSSDIMRGFSRSPDSKKCKNIHIVGNEACKQITDRERKSPIRRIDEHKKCPIHGDQLVKSLDSFTIEREQGKESEDTRSLEGRPLLATQNKESLNSPKKENLHLISSNTASQSTSIRLEAGQILVNVSHHPANISSKCSALTQTLGELSKSM